LKNAERHIPEPVVGSCLVMPPSAGKAAITGAVAGAAIGSAARAASDTIADHRDRGASPLESGTASVGLLALTADDVVLLDGRRGMIGTVAKGVAARAPRGRLVSAELGSGRLTTPLRLSFQDGSAWELSVPRSDVKKARALVDQLAA